MKNILAAKGIMKLEKSIVVRFYFRNGTEMESEDVELSAGGVIGYSKEFVKELKKKLKGDPIFNARRLFFLF
ncbi:hypothetical protein CN957_10070 [Bacillus cereus]|nr:hypothetical protein CN957_10070 [Bacillus cereus]